MQKGWEHAMTDTLRLTEVVAVEVVQMAAAGIAKIQTGHHGMKTVRIFPHRSGLVAALVAHQEEVEAEAVMMKVIMMKVIMMTGVVPRGAMLHRV